METHQETHEIYPAPGNVPSYEYSMRIILYFISVS